jgi:hypothetical protein
LLILHSDGVLTTDTPKTVLMKSAATKIVSSSVPMNARNAALLRFMDAVWTLLLSRSKRSMYRQHAQKRFGTCAHPPR